MLQFCTVGMLYNEKMFNNVGLSLEDDFFVTLLRTGSTYVIVTKKQNHKWSIKKVD